jgi:hypothetical protein
VESNELSIVILPIGTWSETESLNERTASHHPNHTAGESKNAEPECGEVRGGERYRSALNSSVRRLIFEAAPPRIHKS